jgi:hypothetical protein
VEVRRSPTYNLRDNVREIYAIWPMCYLSPLYKLISPVLWEAEHLPIEAGRKTLERLYETAVEQRGVLV